MMLEYISISIEMQVIINRLVPPGTRKVAQSSRGWDGRPTCKVSRGSELLRVRKGGRVEGAGGAGPEMCHFWPPSRHDLATKSLVSKLVPNGLEKPPKTRGYQEISESREIVRKSVNLRKKDGAPEPI